MYQASRKEDEIKMQAEEEDMHPKTLKRSPGGLSNVLASTEVKGVFTNFITL